MSRRGVLVLANVLPWLAGVAGVLTRQTPAGRGRFYWPLTVDQLAAGTAHTHVAVTGRVRLIRREQDGDLHIKLTGVRGFIVAECTPAEPCAMPAVGARITVYGISRYDGEHHWWEVHPVERWTPAPNSGGP